MPKAIKQATAQPKRNRNKRRRAGAKQRQVNAGQINSSLAPVATGYIKPEVSFRSMAPITRGAEVRFVGCDYIGSVSTSSSAASDNVYDIIPGDTTTFPRLSNLAAIFAKYRFLGLRFFIVAKAPSTFAGDMTSCMVYEGTNSGSLSEVEVKNRVGSVTGKFWENHLFETDCGKQSLLWLENFNSADNTRVFGYYHLFTEIGASAIPVADIFVEYDVELCDASSTSGPL
jgi:hypothetical protein